MKGRNHVLTAMLKNAKSKQERTQREVSAGNAIRALASNPLVLSLAKAAALDNEMAAAQQAYLPERLLF